jgi:hypothetical protein
LQIALILLNFEICGTMEIPLTLRSTPGEPLQVNVIPVHPQTEVIGANEGSMTIGGNVSQWEAVENPVCSADNCLCSKYGVQFDICVCNAIPVGQQDLSQCAPDCPFVTMEVKAMSNEKK